MARDCSSSSRHCNILARFGGVLSGGMAEGGSRAVVIQSGSFSCKAGFAGEDFPSTVFPCVVGKARFKGVTPGVGNKERFVGEEAVKRRNVLSLRSPIERGVVRDWDGLETVWHHTFDNELRVPSEEQPVLLADAPLSLNESREKMAQIMFESFGVPAFYLANLAKLSLFASGRLTGLVVHVGHGASYAVPVSDGFAVEHAASRQELAGQDLTEYMSDMLVARGLLSSKSAADRELARVIKEQMCRVALDFQPEMSRLASDASLARTYRLPDGASLAVGKEQLQCPEALLRPAVMGASAPGLGQLAVDSAGKCAGGSPREEDAYANVVLSGGSSLFPGLPGRLESDIERRLGSGQPATGAARVTVVAPPERRYSSWVGGAILPTLASFRHIWVSRQEYLDSGPGIVHQKCL